jgi:hypothetical protein
MYPDAGDGFQILPAERAWNGLRLYADYDVNAYYLKQRWTTERDSE